MAGTLGKQVRDRVTGFSGIVTQRNEHLYGSTQVLVCGRDQAYRRDEWLEEERVEVIGSHALSVVTLGSPPPTPGERNLVP
jgi:hypothetical protein